MAILDEPIQTEEVSDKQAQKQVAKARRRAGWGQTVVKWLTSTDHKIIGQLYLIMSFVFFLLAGLMALAIRAELAEPGMQMLSNAQYNQMFTMHGTIMLFLFATPLFVGFGNVIMPLQIGAPDVAFPRLNMFSFWLFFFGGLTASLSFLVPSGAADFGWFAYAPLQSEAFTPSSGADMWFLGLAMGGLGTILGSVNFITTIYTMRAPGMTMFRMPIFTWNILVTSVLVLMVFPVLAAALLVGFIDREFGTVVFAAENGGAILWQHLFWFFGHPEVYVIALPFFALMTMLIAVPTGVKFFNWVGTMWQGSITFETPMLFTLGFLITFLFGGLTGVMLASPPLDFQVSDTFFVVAHFHYTVFGTVVFMMFAGFYFWWPKMTGKMLDERIGKIHFWLLFWGFQITFLVQHWLGTQGMPRRYADYLPDEGFTLLNQVSSFGALILGISTLFFLYNVYKTWRFAPQVTVDDPWGWGASLEWATSCPPPRHNFVSLPPIRSERPAFDLYHSEVEGLVPQSVVDELVGSGADKKGLGK